MCLVGCGSPGGANRGAVAVLDGVRKASFMVAAWGIGAGECCIFGCWLGECDSICCACALKIPYSRCSCDGAERGGGGRVALEGGGEAATSSGEACRAHEEVECGDCGSLSCIRAKFLEGEPTQPHTASSTGLVLRLLYCVIPLRSVSTGPTR